MNHQVGGLQVHLADAHLGMVLDVRAVALEVIPQQRAQVRNDRAVPGDAEHLTRAVDELAHRGRVMRRRMHCVGGGRLGSRDQCVAR